MIDLNFKDFLEMISAVLISIGGASVLIVGVSKLFGDFFSKRLLDNYNNKHSSELESLKSKYQTQLETTKNELDRAKSQFLRYSEKQFELYNDLWKVLLHTKHQADLLWDNASPESIPSFSEQIRLTKDAIDENMILIEEDHYNKLTELVSKFDHFEFGKIKLIDLRMKSRAQIENEPISEEQVKHVIGTNRNTKNDYDSLVLDIGKSFRNQIKG
jgi:hypothetical protein